ncbi:DUF2232 domain-containing protein [Clostridium sp. 1001271B_151109_B4]|uniref:DUF2232 domain-containing protein n=1 Tax=Clostridium sp. 1001271B_151109_B4 TaxID=2787148 RepID=UPI0018AB50C0|nr:DUF2232 domain-containing protein [Clostridium sp. 1001271B_151109_B4]
MKTKKLTEAAMLSALFVVSSMVAIYTGIAYTLYLDMIVPLFICLIFMRLDFKYTLLSSITSLLIVTFAVGDVASAIWMSQGIIMGLICGYFIRKKGTIFDDLFYSAILGTFVMVLIDIYFSKLTGYSFMKEFDSYKEMFPLTGEYMEIAFNISVATMPIGTILISYIGALFIGKKLRILNENCNEKYMIIKNFKKYGSYICCSKDTYYFGIVYLILIEILKLTGFEFKFVYFKTVIMAIRVVVIYFVLKDSFTFVIRGLSTKVKSNGVSQLIWLGVIYMLLVDFKATLIILVVGSLVINYSMKLRESQINMLNKVVLKR